MSKVLPITILLCSLLLGYEYLMKIKGKIPNDISVDPLTPEYYYVWCKMVNVILYSVK